MVFFSELDTRLNDLRLAFGADASADAIPATMRVLSDEQVIAVLESATAAVRMLETIRIAAAGVVAERSTREHAHSGLAQQRGHRSPVGLVQHIMGSTRGEAAQHVRLGESLLEGQPKGGAAGEVGDVCDARSPWHAPLGEALLAGALSRDQHDAIRRGLGEPPVGAASVTDAARASGAASADASDASDASAEAVRDAWRCAATQLIPESVGSTVEDLARMARQVRDALDPEGAARRFDERYEARSFRMWRDAEGAHHARIDFDDEMAAWVQSIIDSALRPRRGGPRFVDPDERARAQTLLADPRTNEQLTFDLIMSTLRAGALAEPEAVFGTRQAGVRIVVTHTAHSTRDSHDNATGIAHLEDGGDTLPAWLSDRAVCESGHLTCTVDAFGNPLDVSREKRLYTPKQRIALAIRDGGCRWDGCGAPASYCESHHIDHYDEDRGRTDIDRGILLCRFHHMLLHNKSWKIRRDGLGDFMLHPPGGAPPIALRSKSPLRGNWLSPPVAA